MISQKIPSWLQNVPMGLFYRFVLATAWCYFKLFHRHKIYGWEHYYDGPAIIACNHVSFLDPPVVSSSWPEEVHFLARESLFRNRFFGNIIRSLNTHPISGDTADVKVFRLIGEILKNGQKVVLFPEGTRSKSGRLSEIKPGIGLIVLRNQAAIIPTYIAGTDKVLGRGKAIPRLFIKTACIFGSPILWSDFAHLEKKEAQIAIVEAFIKKMAELKDWYEKGAKGNTP